jgi:hypothetical protein
MAEEHDVDGRGASIAQLVAKGFQRIMGQRAS